MTDYQVMPPLTTEEMDALRADIGKRGILVPVVRDQHGHLLDGHHRTQIAAELGIDCPEEIRHVEDHEQARDVAYALNIARRHLNRQQRRDLITREIEQRPDDSDRAIGRRLGCDHKTVGSVRRELRGELPHPVAKPLTLEQAESLIDTQMSGIKKTIVYLLSNKVDKFTIAGWIQDGLAQIEKQCSDPEFIGPLRRHIFYPLIQDVLANGDRLTELYAGPDIHRKPLAPEDLDRLRRRLVGDPS